MATPSELSTPAMGASHGKGGELPPPRLGQPRGKSRELPPLPLGQPRGQSGELLPLPLGEGRGEGGLCTQRYILRLADAALIHGQRLAEWCGHAPVLEEDIALANIALDHIGQARALLSLAAELEGQGRNEDTLAYHRREPEFFNPTLLELPNTPPGDTAPCFARAVLRTYLWSSFATLLWRALTASTHPTLAGIAAKALKESRYHARHSGDWVLRLGDGSEESHRRMQAALDALWPYTAELFTTDAVDAAAQASGLGLVWADLRTPWLADVEALLHEATLSLPPDTPFVSTGKFGRHSEHLGRLLADMQSLARAFPAAVW